MTIHEQKSGKDYFDMCRKITASVIREIAEWAQADGKTTEAESNAAMAILTTCIDGNKARLTKRGGGNTPPPHDQERKMNHEI